jgi:hypothetical protein
MKHDTGIWERLLELLEQRRGENRVRGRQTVLAGRGEIRLEREAHGAAAPQGWLQIRVGPSAETTYLRTGRHRYRLADFASEAAFVDFALAQCRGGRYYLHTQRDTTSYK